VGDLASILQENGHSFHLKYWITERGLRLRRRRIPSKGVAFVESGAAADPALVSSEEVDEVRRLAYHAEQSELTTGKSQYAFLFSIPHGDMLLFPDHLPVIPGNHDFNFLTIVASFGLTLCLRDWVLKRRGAQGIRALASQRPVWPLLSLLVFFHPCGVFQERYLIIASLLLEDGFIMTRDPEFLPRLLAQLWATRKTNSAEIDSGITAATVPVPALYQLAKLVLDHGQDPNIILTAFSETCNIRECRPLHMAPPILAAELVRHGADPTTTDAKYRTPLDWILEHPGELKPTDRSDCASRYQMCKTLIAAGGVASLSVMPHAIKTSLAEFENEGYEVEFLREIYQEAIIQNDEALSQAEAQAQKFYTNAVSNREKRSNKRGTWWYDKSRWLRWW
jgi:hypothetical protein